MPITEKVAQIQGVVADMVAEKAKSNPWVMLSVVASMVISQGTLVTMLLNKATAAEQKADTANTAVQAVVKSVEAVQKNTDLILQVMMNQGKVVVDTVMIPVVVTGADTIPVDTNAVDTAATRPR